MIIRPEAESDAGTINHLHDESFGPGRFAKTAYRLREGIAPVPALSLVASDGKRLVGSVRFTKISIGGKKGGLLLGPLAVYKDYVGHRCGLTLMKKGLALADQQGFALVLLVGDPVYYQKAGFELVPLGQITFPGPVDYHRLLAYELHAGALDHLKGLVAR